MSIENLGKEEIVILPAGPDHFGEYGYVLADHVHLVDDIEDGVNVDVSGRLLAHDIIEHAVSKGKTLDGFEDELWAVGAAWWVRGTFGDVTYKGIASDAQRILRDAIMAEHQFSEPDEVEFFAQEAMDNAIKEELERLVESEMGDLTEEGHTEEEIRSLTPVILGHLACGYQAADKRYGDDYKAHVMFKAIQDEIAGHAGRHIPEEEVSFNQEFGTGLGYRLVLTIDYENMEVRGIYHEPEFDEEPEFEEEDEAA